jgi:hypothetical protein
MRFDRVAVLDWSASGSPTKGKDSIWLGVSGPEGTWAENLPTRTMAEAALHNLIDDSLRRGQTLLLGADFNFGAPSGSPSGSPDGPRRWRGGHGWPIGSQTPTATRPTTGTSRPR